MVLTTALGGLFGLVPAAMKFLDKRGERRAQQEQAQLMADKGLLEGWIEQQQAALAHDTSTAQNIEWQGWLGRFTLAARAMVRPAAFYSVTGLFGLVVVGNLCFGWVMDPTLLAMLHEALGAVLGFYFCGRNGERLLKVA